MNITFGTIVLIRPFSRHSAAQAIITSAGIETTGGNVRFRACFIFDTGWGTTRQPHIGVGNLYLDEIDQVYDQVGEKTASVLQQIGYYEAIQ